MLSDFLHDLHTGSDAAVGGLGLPAGSLGDVLGGLLRVPAELIYSLENIVRNFGS